MHSSRFLAPYVSAAHGALVMLVTVSLAVGLAVAAPVPTVAAVQSSCGILYNCVTLTLDPYGSGSGKIVATDQVDTITCRTANGALTGTCTHQFKWYGTGLLSLGITYTPDAHTMLCGSKGSTCTGSGVSQTYTLGISPSVLSAIEHEYVFQLVRETVTVTRTGIGSGTVGSSLQPGISCGATCSAQFDYGTSLKLTAKPDAGAVFTAWTGACAGQKATCTLKLTKNLATNAVFSLPSATQAPTAHPVPQPTSGPSAAPASAAPSSSSPPASPGSPSDSASPAESGLTAMAGATPPASASTAPAQTPLPAAGDAGVPVALVVVMVVMALVIGGLAAALALVLRRGKAS